MSNQEVHMEHLQAKGLFEESKLAGVMRRVREECRSFDEKTLTKLIHELPAKMNDIRRLKGKKMKSFSQNFTEKNIHV